MSKQKRIDIYDFDNNDVEVVPTEHELKLDNEVEAKVNGLWQPKAKAGWKSSWIPLVSSIYPVKELVTTTETTTKIRRWFNGSIGTKTKSSDTKTKERVKIVIEA